MNKHLSNFRRFMRMFVYDAGWMNFYGFRSRVFVLFSAHVYIGICVRSKRLMIEIV